MTLLELTIPFDTLLEEAALRKKDKYAELVESIERELQSDNVEIESHDRILQTQRPFPLYKENHERTNV